MSAIAVTVGAIAMGVGALGKVIGGSIGGRARRNEQRNAKTAQAEALSAFRGTQFENPFVGMTRPSVGLQDPTTGFQDFTAGMQNPFVGAQNFASQMENVAEDLTVDTTAAQFMAQQQQQGLANTLGGLRGAAGSSGVAALAQSLASQQSQNLQAARASIATQEQANRKLAAQQAGQIQQMTAEESSLNQQRRMEQAAQQQEFQARTRTGQQEFVAQLAQQRGLQGAQLDLRAAQLQGEGDMFKQRMDFDKASTILAANNQRLAAANNARQQATQNILGGFGDLTAGGLNMITGGFGGGGGTGGTGGTGGINTGFNTGGDLQSGGGRMGSDRRLKENIKFIGKSKKGFKIYTFEYKDKKYGEGVYQGVMSDEIPKENVVINQDGYDMVDYSNLDVEFKKLK
jgi:hypothetical protein